MFELKLLPRTELKQINSPSGRTYETPDGEFKSVTTILSEYFDKSGLELWKQRVGEKEAEKISIQAANDGTRLHNVLEKFLLNENINEFHSIEKTRFISVKNRLEKNVKKVYGVEFPCWSKNLKTAGKTDAIVQWNSDNAIFDLKTSRKFKKEEYIENYFTQATAYGIMVNEKFPELQINKIVICFSSNNFDCYFYEKNISDYKDLVNKIFKGS